MVTEARAALQKSYDEDDVPWLIALCLKRRYHNYEVFIQDLFERCMVSHYRVLY